jgi:DnaJ-class molecular chaperone
MKTEIRKAPKIALCRCCYGTGKKYWESTGDTTTCPQCDGSGRVMVSCVMQLDIEPYKTESKKD